MVFTPKKRRAFSLISSLSGEIISLEELLSILERKKSIVAYDGFEPSGNMHIAQGLMKTVLVNAFVDLGIKFKILIADWHARANNKLGGDLIKIQTTGRYFIEVWKASGMKLDCVEFVWASDIVKDVNYWDLVMRIAIQSNLKRIIRCSQIMGRSEHEKLTAAQIFYPCMQCADIFYLKADICQLGLDQRKVNMLAREVASHLGFSKPIAVHHHMLMGLMKPSKVPQETNLIERTILLKMSKSIPDSAIFVTDSREDVERKIRKAYCPEGDVKDNPILEYCKYLIFPFWGNMRIKRLKKHGGDIHYSTYVALEKDFIEKKLYPLDLKIGVIEYVNKMLEPIRFHFKRNPEARKLKEEVESYVVTR